MVVQMAGWWRQVWQLWRRWRFYYRYFTTTAATSTPTPFSVLMVVVVVVMVGGNVLLLLPPTTPTMLPLEVSYEGDMSGNAGVAATTTTTTTTTARPRDVRPIKMDWKRRWIRPWPAKKGKEEEGRRRRERGGGGGGGSEGRGFGKERWEEDKRRQDENEMKNKDEDNKNENISNKETRSENKRRFEKVDEESEEEEENRINKETRRENKGRYEKLNVWKEKEEENKSSKEVKEEKKRLFEKLEKRNEDEDEERKDKNKSNKETKEQKKKLFKKLNKQGEKEGKEEDREAEDIHKQSHQQNTTVSAAVSCEDYRVGFAIEGSLPPVALASYPGSGNTWLRELLEGASGVFTGSTYDDQHLYVTGLGGELEPWSAGTTLTQKTHSASPSVASSFEGRALILIRNPYHAILSYHNYLFGGHLGFAPVANYRSKDWGAFVHMQARAWIDMALNWTKPTHTRLGGGRRRGVKKEAGLSGVQNLALENIEGETEEEEEEDMQGEGKERRVKEWMLVKMKKRRKDEGKKNKKELKEEMKDGENEEQEEPKGQMEVQKTIQEEEEEEEEEVGKRVAVVHYEELVQDPITPLLPALAILPIPQPSPHRLDCLRKHQHRRRRFKRVQEYLPEGLEVFSPVDRDKLDRAIRYVDHHLRRRHLPPLPLHLYDYYNNTTPLTQKTVRVKCFEGETRVECEARVDELNAAWRKRSKGGVSEGNSSSMSRDSGREGDKEKVEEEEEEEEETGPLERFAGTKVGMFLTRGFTSLMHHLRGDPLLQNVARTP